MCDLEVLQWLCSYFCCSSLPLLLFFHILPLLLLLCDVLYSLSLSLSLYIYIYIYMYIYILCVISSFCSYVSSPTFFLVNSLANSYFSFPAYLFNCCFAFLFVFLLLFSPLLLHTSYPFSLCRPRRHPNLVACFSSRAVCHYAPHPMLRFLTNARYD
jgi:hypothetical protein